MCTLFAILKKICAAFFLFFCAANASLLAGSTILVARGCVLVRASLVALVVFAGSACTLFVATRLDMFSLSLIQLFVSDLAAAVSRSDKRNRKR